MGDRKRIVIACEVRSLRRKSASIGAAERLARYIGRD